MTISAVRKPLYHASLSTMWAVGNYSDLNDFRLTAQKLGFTHLELNHQVNTAMLNGFNPSPLGISSIHEPCPADVSVEELKRKDWLISSLNEENRRNGIDAIKRSIPLADKLIVPIIVVHCGAVSLGFTLEKKLRTLYEKGGNGSGDYKEIFQRMVFERSKQASPHLEAVKRSLLELLDYARHYNIRLGLENRYHYNDIPIQDEMKTLLELAEPGRLGFIYDVGHAQALDHLGFLPHREWLQRFSTRMIGTHLHDVRGVTDHLPPGLGEVDYKMVADYLPENAYRALEINPKSSFDQIAAGLKYLADQGCIRKYSAGGNLL
ncbi:MAG TPA: TIM barrel protein [Anaerolineales bacterium]|nr:TIM barrel protein [Anaerolineales bacterium]